MSELTLVLIRFAYLAILWIFVLSAVSVIRSDMFGARVAREGGRAERRAAKAAAKKAHRCHEVLRNGSRDRGCTWWAAHEGCGRFSQGRIRHKLRGRIVGVSTRRGTGSWIDASSIYTTNLRTAA